MIVEDLSFSLPSMTGLLSKLLRKKRVHNDALLDSNSDQYRMQNAQFVSFLQKSGFRRQLIDRHEKSKRFKKVLGIIVAWGLGGGFLWVVVESAQALELF
ncbi:MAG: hypothetical protein OSB19_11635 [Opitutaceae bacterium]|nr:hypothetical protein [Opitutaceae bacterium]